MSNNYPDVYHLKFTAMVELAIQQRESRLEKTCFPSTGSGETDSIVNKVGQITARRNAPRGGTVQHQHASLETRWCSPNSVSTDQIIDPRDKSHTTVDLDNSLVQAAAAAHMRERDEIISEAWFASAKTGKQGGSTTAFGTTHSTGNVIAVDTGAAAATGMNLEKILAALEVLKDHNVDPMMEEIYCVISPRQWRDLYGEIQVVSTDYNGGGSPVRTGQIPSILGVTFVEYTSIPTDGNSYRRCALYAKSAMTFMTWRGMSSKKTIRADINAQPDQISTDECVGAARVEEKTILEIKCSEA